MLNNKLEKIKIFGMVFDNFFCYFKKKKGIKKKKWIELEKENSIKTKLIKDIYVCMYACISCVHCVVAF